METQIHAGFHSSLLFLLLAFFLNSLPMQICIILSELTQVDPTPDGLDTFMACQQRFTLNILY